MCSAVIPSSLQRWATSWAANMAAYGDDSSLSAFTFIPPVTRQMVSLGMMGKWVTTQTHLRFMTTNETITAQLPWCFGDKNIHRQWAGSEVMWLTFQKDQWHGRRCRWRRRRCDRRQTRSLLQPPEGRGWWPAPPSSPSLYEEPLSESKKRNEVSRREEEENQAEEQQQGGGRDSDLSSIPSWTTVLSDSFLLLVLQTNLFHFHSVFDQRQPSNLELTGPTNGPVDQRSDWGQFLSHELLLNQNNTNQRLLRCGVRSTADGT